MPRYRLPFGEEQFRHQRQMRKKQLELAEQLVKMADEWTYDWAIDLRDRLKTSMVDVLDRIPGSTVAERCRNIGISRQTYYAWLRGDLRPSVAQAKRLSKKTGIPAEKIRSERSAAPAASPSTTVAAG